MGNPPKFKIGEKVILCSRSHPHLNGVYHIKDLVFARMPYFCRHSQAWIKSPYYFDHGYQLEEVIGRIDHDGETLWGESALRKFNDPSEFESFEALMANLNKLPVTA